MFNPDQQFSLEFIEENIIPKEKYKPFPQVSERKVWETILQDPLNLKRKNFIIEKAEEILKSEWQVIPLSRFCDFIKTGDREAFERIYMKRRQQLACVALAFAFTYEQKYLEKTADMLWAICEESSWALSAHVDRKILRNGNKDICPDLTQPSVDLFSCETSAILAEILFLLENELNSLSPTIKERVEKEIDQRILLPFEQRSDFPWLRAKNNWTSWCICSVSIAATYVVNSPKRLAKILKHGLELLQPYIDAYPPDFSCDEGPSYWGVSPGALLLLFETLYTRTNGALNVFNSEEFARMGKYFSDMHINSPWFFNYSDTPAMIHRSIVKPYRYGDRIGNEDLRNLALLSLRNWSVDGEPDPSLGLGSDYGNFLYALRELFWIPLDVKPKKLEKKLIIWYHHAQLLIAREKICPDSGLVLAVKGGTNAESHNHIDVGEFLVFADGEPVIVDPGRGEYKRQTFSHERYNICWIAGKGHNLLQFGEHEQSLGRESRAEVLNFRNDEEITELEFDLTKTFDKTVNLIFWKRKYILHRNSAPLIKIVDDFKLKRPFSVLLPLYTVKNFLLLENYIEFILSSGKKITLKWSSEFYADSEPLPDEDPFLLKFWGGLIMKKITLKSKEKLSSGSLELTFSTKN